MNKKLFIFAILLFFLVPYANAITGSIGNAKAIVTVDLSESNVLERTVLVKNVNDFAITIKLEAVDDLEKITKIIDSEFELGANEEKKAAYKVTIPGEGTYNGNIVVFFNPPEGKGAGVVLQSNLIIKAVGQGSEIIEDQEESDEESDDIEKNDNKVTGSIVSEKTSSLTNIDLSVVLFVILIAVIVIAGLTVLMRRI